MAGGLWPPVFGMYFMIDRDILCTYFPPFDYSRSNSWARAQMRKSSKKALAGFTVVLFASV